jgi:hypothetical protein
VRDRRPEGKPAGVPDGAKQAGETQARWSWVEPSVWTERMLTALEKGVKGGKWFSLIDKHSHRTTFPGLDQWIRMRLRSILRRRHHGKGRGRGCDHQRWPNAYFAELGLFSAVAAHAEARQSPRR